MGNGPFRPSTLIASATIDVCDLLSLWELKYDPRIEPSRRQNTSFNGGRIDKTFVLASLWGTTFFDLQPSSILPPLMPVTCYRCGSSSMTLESSPRGGRTPLSMVVESTKHLFWPHYGERPFSTFNPHCFCHY